MFNSKILKQPDFSNFTYTCPIYMSTVFLVKNGQIWPLIWLHHLKELALSFQKNIKSLKSVTPNKSYGCLKILSTLQVYVLHYRYMYYTTGICTTLQVYVLHYRYMYYTTGICTVLQVKIGMNRFTSNKTIPTNHTPYLSGNPDSTHVLILDGLGQFNVCLLITGHS